ncbi:PREDICTED: uncharacterized protein LOC109153749 [Ipomoea nil]|uniref:uncharacterized protein LOC109153749 n=1 Tax=Ipomoea nil TaxID=35883 RepID=UPI0009019679|nr:PREDICTED: uncharacterized protein LOC109153749 [Ipomoea nil]
MSIDTDYFELELDSNVFHHTNVRSIFVMMDNIKDLLTMKWLDVSIIQVFIMYLHSNQFGTDSVGFVCPTQIAKATLDFNFNIVTAYIANAMVTSKDKTLILAPYHQSAFRSYMNQQVQRAKNLFYFKHVKVKCNNVYLLLCC